MVSAAALAQLVMIAGLVTGLPLEDDDGGDVSVLSQRRPRNPEHPRWPPESKGGKPAAEESAEHEPAVEKREARMPRSKSSPQTDDDEVKTAPRQSNVSSRADPQLSGVISSIAKLSDALAKLENSTALLQVVAADDSARQRAMHLICNGTQLQLLHHRNVVERVRWLSDLLPTMRDALLKLTGTVSHMDPTLHDLQSELLPRMVKLFSKMSTARATDAREIPLALLHKSGYDVFDMIGFNPSDSHVNKVLDVTVLKPKF